MGVNFYGKCRLRMTKNIGLRRKLVLNGRDLAGIW
jgi:hypothetical protein